jgi:hypothetical protein
LESSVRTSTARTRRLLAGRFADRVACQSTRRGARRAGGASLAGALRHSELRNPCGGGLLTSTTHARGEAKARGNGRGCNSRQVTADIARGGAARCLLQRELRVSRQAAAEVRATHADAAASRRPRQERRARGKRAVPEATSLTELVQGEFCGCTGREFE